MAHCCSQCSFTAQFESALIMHHQLHHENNTADGFPVESEPYRLEMKSSTMPRVSTPKPNFLSKERNFKLPSRTSSATKLFEKLRAKICRSRQLVTHKEDNAETPALHELSAISECTSKALQDDIIFSKPCVSTMKEGVETYGCHLCDFDADRITVLDRHLLNDHKIGLENLLKLVMAKTKDSLAEDSIPIFGIRQPYYKPQDEIIEDGEFVIETVTPKIKILKHAATNTEIQWADIPNLKDNCRMITKELDKLINYPMDKCDKDKFSAKMRTLNECMCKFVDSSNTLKRVLTKRLDSKSTLHERGGDEFYNLGLGDRGTPRDWERAHSERMERSRKKFDDNSLSKHLFYF
ncbi:hypothetical protein K1T71_014127 [Dendrolimus kikuchii]|uniref:Uncharacterized protein n=1 Tax=Dendrolimus kikuchii TaxID=765133 RepID=A0ACC1CFE9_9NEOP|nr:hypothetical protein K1T71_014127 [Dendrolimus kikuchii]